MEGKIIVVPVVVSDQRHSLEFFTEKAGFAKKTDVASPGGGRWVTVGLPGQDLELSLWQVGSPTDPSQKEHAAHWAVGSAPPIVIQVPDCKRLHQEMSSCGVEFVLPPKEQPWGTVATFRDPDGNLFSMTQPPGARPTG